MALCIFSFHRHSLSLSHICPILLHVFPQVNIKTVLLGKGCLTLLAFVGFLPCVQSLMDLQVVGHFKTLPTLWANEWALSRVARLVLPEGLWTIENLGAEITLEFFLSQVDIIDVLIKNGLFKESFSALFTDMRSSSGCRWVHSLIMLSQKAMDIGSVWTELAEKLFPDNFSMQLLNVVEKCALFCEGCATRVAQVLPSSCKQIFLIVVETSTIWVCRFTGDLFVFCVDTNVVAKCPTTWDDGVTLQALVTIALMILKHRSNLKFINSFRRTTGLQQNQHELQFQMNLSFRKFVHHAKGLFCTNDLTYPASQSIRWT